MKIPSKKNFAKSLLVFVLIILFVGCGEKVPFEVTPTSQSKSDPTHKPSATFILKQTESSTQAQALKPAPTFTSSVPLVTPPTNSPKKAWNVYTHPTGVEIEYPASWKVKVSYDEMTVLGNIYLSVYPRPRNDQKITDPHTWEPNEGGMVVLWEKPVDVNGIKGIEFLWGDGLALQDGNARGSELIAILYNPEKELDVRLTSAPPRKLMENFSPDRFDTSLDSSMTIFERMFKSIRFCEPLRPSATVEEVDTPKAPTVTVTPTAVLETFPYPAPTGVVFPTGTPDLNLYPAAPGVIEPTATETPVVLPLLAPYPAPGPFADMRVIYWQAEHPGLWSKSILGNEDGELKGWWNNPDRAIKYGKLTFTPSPAGEYLLFSAFDDTNFSEPEANSFWVDKLDGSQPLLQVTANEDWYPENPIWSPDGEQIAYRRTYLRWTDDHQLITGRGFEIWVINVDGLSEKRIFSGPDMPVTTFGGQLMLFQWLYNGYIYFALQDPGPLFAVSPNDGEHYQLLENISPIDWSVSLSPDGQHVRQSLDLSAGLIKQAGLVPVEVPFSNNRPIWSADGKKILYREQDNHETDDVKIILHDLSSGIKKEVMRFKEADKLLGLSPDERFIAYLDATQALYVFDLSSNTTILIKQGQAQSQPNYDTVHFEGWLPVP